MKVIDWLGWTLISISWTGLALAEAGHFSTVNVLIISGLFLGAGAFIGARLRTSPPGHIDSQVRAVRQEARVTTRRLVVEVAMVCGVLGLAASLYFRPGEMIFSTHDAGVRFNSGAHLASTGHIVIEDPDYAIAAATGALTFTLGIHEVDRARGILLPQFSGASEVWGALILTTVDGVSGILTGYHDPPFVLPARVLELSALFAIASVALLFSTLRITSGFLVAWTAMAGLALSYPEIYYARVPMSEMLEQLFFVVALYGLVRFWQTGALSHALLGGCAVGMTVLTHLDAVLIYVPIFVWLSITLARRQANRAHAAFALASGLLLIQASWHDLTFLSFYLRSNALPVATFLTRSPTSLVVLTGVALGWVGILGAVRAGWIDPIARSHRTRIGIALLIATIGAAAYFVRPLIVPPSIDYAADGTISVVHSEGVTWVILGRYLSPVTLLASAIGLSFAVVRRPSRLVWSLFLVGGMYALFLTVNPLVSPHQPFWVRRFLPLVIPILITFAAIGAASVRFILPWIRVGIWSARILSLALVGMVALNGQPLWRIQPEFQGGLAQTTQFAQSLPANSIILADHGAIATWLPMPLTYLFHREAFAVQPENLNDERMDLALQTWWNLGKTVLFVTDGGRTTLNPGRWGFERVADQAFKFPQLKPDFWTPPTSVQTIEFQATAYRIVPLSQKSAPSFPFSLTMGNAGYGLLRSGFQRVDGTGVGAYRWTDREAIADLPRPPTNRLRLILRVGGNRPVGVPPAEMVVSVDNHELDTIRFDNVPISYGFDVGFRDIILSSPSSRSSGSGPMKLSLRVNTWRPSDFGLGDVRELGVAVSEIRIEEAR